MGPNDPKCPYERGQGSLDAGAGRGARDHGGTNHRWNQSLEAPGAVEGGGPEKAWFCPETLTSDFQLPER